MANIFGAAMAAAVLLAVGGCAATSSVDSAGDGSAAVSPEPELPASELPAEGGQEIVATRTVDMAVSTGVTDPKDLFDYFATQLIVVGIVADVEYAALGEDIGEAQFDFPITAITVDVEQASKSVDAQIVVRTNGGYLPVTESMRAELEQQGTSVHEDAVVEYLGIGGARPTQIGDKVALFLYQVGPDGVTDATYMMVGDSAGRFDLDEASGRYLRASNKAEVLDAAQLEQALSVR